MSVHTPGPWEALTDGVYKGNDCFVLCDTDVFSKATNEANARLIAAAPEMLAALKQCEAIVAYMRNCDPIETNRVNAAKLLPEVLAALAKAEGRQS